MDFQREIAERAFGPARVIAIENEQSGPITLEHVRAMWRQAERARLLVVRWESGVVSLIKADRLTTTVDTVLLEQRDAVSDLQDWAEQHRKHGGDGYIGDDELRNYVATANFNLAEDEEERWS